MTLSTKVGSQSIFLLALAFGLPFGLQACVDNGDPDDDGGSGGATDGSGGATDGSGGSTDGSGGSESSAACDNGANFEAHVEEQVTANCGSSNVPNCNITDFSAASYLSDGTWGDDTSLTGETFDYQDDDSELAFEVVGDALNITSTVSGSGWTGVGLSFGPCVDATDFDGMQITISGEMAEGAVFDVQLQTDENYPLDYSDGIGTCAFTDEDTQWDECQNNYFRAEGITADAYTYYIPWSEFTEGMPNASLDPKQLRAIQLQTGCDEDKAPCAVTIQVHDVRFYRDEAPDLGPEPEGPGGASGQ